jgi:hypothetical protein
MKNSIRVIVAAGVLMLAGTVPACAGVWGGDPPPSTLPPSTQTSSTTTAVVNAVLTVLGV